MPFGGLLTVGLIGAGGSIFSGLLGSSASKKAAEQQQQATQAGINEQQREFDIANERSRPFVQAGQQSIGTLMDLLRSGQFGFGSTGTADIPQFHAPTLEDARNSPGYEFARQQGNKGILQGAAAAGGNIGGGTLRALDSFGTGLADSTYGNVFNRALDTYKANLTGYGTKLAAQQQEFGQLLAPAQIGSGSTANLNATQATSASSIAQLMQNLGTSAAAGTVGSSNAIAGGIGGATNSLSQSLLLNNLGLGKPSPWAQTPIGGNVSLSAAAGVPG